MFKKRKKDLKVTINDSQELLDRNNLNINSSLAKQNERIVLDKLNIKIEETESQTKSLISIIESVAKRVEEQINIIDNVVN